MKTFTCYFCKRTFEIPDDYDDNKAFDTVIETFDNDVVKQAQDFAELCSACYNKYLNTFGANPIIEVILCVRSD